MSHQTTSPVTRRQAVGMAGAAGAALLLSKVSGPDRLLESLGVSDVAQAAATSCVLTPDKTEGPYFVDEKLNRSDIRTDPSDGSVQPGTPVSLTMVVVRADGNCAPVAGRGRRHLARQRRRQVLRRRQRGHVGQEVPARPAGHRRQRPGEVHDDLPRLVPGPRRPHPLQDPHLRRHEPDLRVHLAAVLRPVDGERGLRDRRVRRRAARRRRRTRRTASTAATARSSSSRSRPTATAATPARSSSASRACRAARARAPARAARTPSAPRSPRRAFAARRPAGASCA